jgi:hypothetical protein
MTTASITQTDIRLRDAVVHQLDWHPEVDASAISVTVSNGVVTLKGTVRSWLQRDAAERAAGSAPGIRRVDNQIVVEPADPVDERALETVDEICGWIASPSFAGSMRSASTVPSKESLTLDTGV